MTSHHPLETLTAADFRDIKGSRFRLTVELPEHRRQAAFEFELADVTEVTRVNPGGFRNPFSVLFHGPLQPVLPQSIYRLEHERLGMLELFLVPLGPNEPIGPGEQPTAMRYEAAFG